MYRISLVSKIGLTIQCGSLLPDIFRQKVLNLGWLSTTTAGPGRSRWSAGVEGEISRLEAFGQFSQSKFISGVHLKQNPEVGTSAVQHSGIRNWATEHCWCSQCVISQSLGAPAAPREDFRLGLQRLA